jgi:DNA-binding transcriptional MerR regulator
MQQLDLFGAPMQEPRPAKQKQPKPAIEKVLAKKPTNLMTNPMGTEMVVNDQIKIKIKQIKSQLGDKRTDNPRETKDLIDLIKAKLKKEFDLNSPVLKNDDDGIAQRKIAQKIGEPGIESFAIPSNVPPDNELFKKQYYTMGAVSEMFHINPSMLRYWENEFDILKPKKNKKGDRHFRPIDIKNIELIYDLIRNRKFTIEGAKNFLKKNKQKAADKFAAIQALQQLKTFLIELKNQL